jgi:cell division protein FtsL
MTDFDQPPVRESKPIAEQRRLLNRWSVFALLIVSAAATVGYVSNVIAVNRLLARTQQMQRGLDSLKTVNESLRTEVNALQSSERITRIASEKLSMVPPSKAPVVLDAE